MGPPTSPEHEPRLLLPRALDASWVSRGEVVGGCMTDAEYADAFEFFMGDLVVEESLGVRIFRQSQFISVVPGDLKLARGWRPATWQLRG